MSPLCRDTPYVSFFGSPSKLVCGGGGVGVVCGVCEVGLKWMGGE